MKPNVHSWIFDIGKNVSARSTYIVDTWIKNTYYEGTNTWIAKIRSTFIRNTYIKSVCIICLSTIVTYINISDYKGLYIRHACTRSIWIVRLYGESFWMRDFLPVILLLQLMIFLFMQIILILRIFILVLLILEIIVLEMLILRMLVPLIGWQYICNHLESRNLSNIALYWSIEEKKIKYGHIPLDWRYKGRRVEWDNIVIDYWAD